jgi:cytochrome c biogenesis protein CcmG, thiol:disulfide interchange protein DsbE
MNKRFLLFSIPLVAFLGMAVLLGSGLGKDPTKLESQMIGKPLPEFTKHLLISPEQVVTEKDIKGPALINVFASWCPSCYYEHPHLMELQARNAVKIYGLNHKDKREAGLKFVNDLGNPYDMILFDDNGRLGIDLGVYGAPETFVVNADNQIVYRHVGIVDEQVFETILKPKMLSTQSN